MIVSLDYEGWQGNPEEATQEVAALLLRWQPGVIAPTERVLRKWRQEEVLTRMGRRFTGRNLLEAVYVAWQRKEGQALPVITARLQPLSLKELEELVTNQTPRSDAVAPPIDERRIERTVILLAHGVLKQFQAVRMGAPVGVGLSHPDARVANNAIPLQLRQAQAQLARLAFEHGQPDDNASVHELLVHCMQPFKQWAPQPLAHHPEFANVVLIDAEYRVPSRECGDFAALGGHLTDIIENQIHQQLMVALDALDPEERDDAYTLVRRFVAENPMVSQASKTWRKLLMNPRLSLDIRGWLQTVYEPAHAAMADNRGFVTYCGHCQAPLLRTKEGWNCALTACRANHPRTLPGDAIGLEQALVARPEVLKYWCNPALDELRLHHELTALFPQESVLLYPNLDLCDVAIGTRIGIDVKDYADPVLLARKLNRGVGGLRLYDEMVVAVATRQVRNRPEYLPQVREHLQTALRRSLRILSVDDVLQTLRTHGQFA
ncbi:hypothetical protein [Hymenobacter sp. 5414T-23]|uniref:restriction endonuclease-related protein n=1 Tax=Hymenobacter sp. 5414T-23 TaxID=2932252 RepID=UPI001FD16468|nr:hypothetical protein [Hymenobacter sp. 5414T-23]UOQ83245.1 hypothetical protein MUN83_21180 [Hymenobacter sp. 5414T-23]